MGCGVSSSADESTVPTSIPTNGPSHHQPVEQRNRQARFNYLENEINTLEETKCFEEYRVLADDLSTLGKQMSNYTQASNRTSEQIVKLIDLSKLSTENSLKDLVMERWSSLSRKIKSNTKYVNLIELLNIQEILAIKMELTRKDTDRFVLQSEKLKVTCDKLQDLYQQRDSILSSYASDKEMQLESELDELMEERHTVEVGHIRWLNTSQLVQEALKCVDSAVEQLKQYNADTDSELSYRYTCMEEVRNNLAVYMYKMVLLKDILVNIKLPHLTSDDLTQLEICTNQLFADTFEADKLKQFGEYVLSMRTKTVTQHTWIKQVLATSIKQDLVAIRQQCQNKILELRLERNNQIRQSLQQQSESEEKLEEQPKSGDKLDSPFDLRVDSGVDSDLGDSVPTEQYIGRMLPSGHQSQLSNGTPFIPPEDLAPIPSDLEIFGKIIQLQSKHNRELAEFVQNQQFTRDRVAQGLREKLTNRRSRRSRMEMHKRQLEALQESPHN